jgi:Asp-tRNA(Asn)/Glu-tRNA(Gln) amidotransferase A subunit family amidase
MTLCWSMDKLGPMARSAEDCALVYDAVHGHDRRDPSTVDTSFSYEQRRDVRELRVGYYESAFDEEYDNKEADLASLDGLRRIGFDLRSIELPNDLPVDAALLTLSVEAAAAFDDLTRSGASEQMVRQTRNAWPHVFRAARFVTAVEFLQANRVRTQLIRRMAEVFSDIDVLVTPTFGGRVLGITNLTGHPCVCVPNGFGTAAGVSERRRPGSISFIGGLYEDAAALEVAQAFQQATDFHRRRPPIK